MSVSRYLDAELNAAIASSMTKSDAKMWKNAAAEICQLLTGVREDGDRGMTTPYRTNF